MSEAKRTKKTEAAEPAPEKSARRGRPPKPERDRKTVMLRVMVSETQREELATAAAGEDLSVWIRTVALRAARNAKK